MWAHPVLEFGDGSGHAQVFGKRAAVKPAVTTIGYPDSKLFGKSLSGIDHLAARRSVAAHRLFEFSTTLILATGLHRRQSECYFSLGKVNSTMLERVLLARRCRKRAAEWKNLAETAMTAAERSGHLIVAEHYNAVAETAERAVKATLEERFPHPRPASASLFK